MNDTTNAGPVPDPQTEQVSKPGDFIRAQREAAGMTQAQVGEKLNLTLHYIRALENDEYRKLPGLTFVKGYFRAYARLLKIDEGDVLTCYDRYVATLELPEFSQPQTLHVRRRGDQAVLWALVAGLLLVAALGAGWWFFGRGADAPAAAVIGLPQRQPAPAVAQPQPERTPPAGLQQPPVQQGQPASVAAPAAETPAAADSTLPAPAASAATAATVAATATDAAIDVDAAAQQGLAPAEAVAGQTAAAQTASDVTAPDVTSAEPTVTVQTAIDQTAAGQPAVEPTPGGQAAPAETPTGQAPGGQPAAGQPAAGQPAPEAAPQAPAATAPDAADAAATTADAAALAAAAPQGARRVELLGSGNDRLQLEFSGSSWVEVNDAAMARQYSGMMNAGDQLSIRATAPFHVLFGNARGVAVEFNEAAQAIESSIRDDNTARVRISSEGVSPWVLQ